MPEGRSPDDIRKALEAHDRATAQRDAENRAKMEALEKQLKAAQGGGRGAKAAVAEVAGALWKKTTGAGKGIGRGLGNMRESLRRKPVAPLEVLDTQAVVAEIKAEIARREATAGTPMSQEEKNRLAQQMFLAARETHQDRLAESSRFGKAWKKTSECWDSLDKTRTGKAIKVAAGAAFIAGATYVTGDMAGVLPQGATLAGRLATRGALSIGINLALTSGTAAKLIDAVKTKKPAGPKGKLAKVVNVRNVAMAASLGTVFVLSGPLTLGVAAGGARLRILFKKMEEWNKKREEAQKQVLDGNFNWGGGDFNESIDPDILAANLVTLGNDYNAFAKGTKIRKRGLAALNSLTSIAVGIATMGTHDAEASGLRADLLAKLGVDDAGGDEEEPTQPNADKTDQTPLAPGEILPGKPAGSINIPSPSISQDSGDINNPQTPDTPSTKLEVNPDAIVHKGQGIEHVLRRQIERNEELAKSLGWDGKESLRQFSGRAAHLDAIDKGYVDGSGEVRVKVADQIAYQYEKDASGNWNIVELNAKDGARLEDHIKGSTFEPKTSDGLEKEYEYSHTGQARSTVRASIPEASPRLGLEDSNTADTTYEDSIRERQGDEPITTQAHTRSGETPPETDSEVRDIRERIEANIQDARRLYDLEHSGRGRTMQPGFEEELRQDPYVDPNQGAGGRSMRPGFWGSIFGRRDEDLEQLNRQALAVQDEISRQRVDDIYQDNLEKLFPRDTEEVWRAVRNFSADEMISREDDRIEQGHERLVDYLRKVEDVTGLAPKPETLIRSAETISDYLHRALEWAAKNNKLKDLEL